MAKAVIFDVDGTLVDSVDAHARAWERAFAHFGKDIPFADVRSQIGKGGDQLLPVFLAEDEVETLGPEIEAFRKDLFLRQYRDGIQGFPGTRALFEALKARGRRVALASSAKGDELDHYKKVADIVGLTEAETSSDDAEKSKPHPDIFQAALDRLGLAPETVLVVGDTPYDAEAARKAGITSVGVLCGGFPAEALRSAGAARLYKDPEDLLARLDEWVDLP